jgi:hypothetical protein
MTTIDERVAAGSAWLDANRPGWWQRINLDTLDLGDPCECVLGQEDGNYWDTAPDLGGDAAVLGFNTRPWCRDPDQELAGLEAAWRTLIQARRDADSAPAVRPRRTHDGQRMRDTDTADVAGEVL